MADTTTLESVVSQAQSNGTAAPTKAPVGAANQEDASAGEVADDELSEIPKTKLDAPDEGDEVDLGEEDQYDFEEEQQAVEGEDDEYAGPYQVEDEGEDDEYHDEDGEGDDGDQPEATNGATGGKPNLTALLLGNPNDAEEDEEEYNDDEDAEYNVDEDDEDEGDDYMEESTPITPTSKKRGIQEAREDDEDEEEVVVEEGASKKKVRS